MRGIRNRIKLFVDDNTDNWGVQEGSCKYCCKLFAGKAEISFDFNDTQEFSEKLVDHAIELRERIYFLKGINPVRKSRFSFLLNLLRRK